MSMELKFNKVGQKFYDSLSLIGKENLKKKKRFSGILIVPSFNS